MTKIIVISDTHYGLKSADYDRNAEIHRIFMDCIQYSILSGADYFVHCGDLGHVANPTSEVHALWSEIFEKLAETNMISYFMLGNHDVVKDKDRPYGSLAPLKALDYGNVGVVSGFTIVSVRGIWLAFMPYFNSAYVGEDHNSAYNKQTQSYPFAGVNSVIFTHLNIDNAKTDSDFLLRPVHATIPGCIFENEKNLVISGHIHKPQQLRENHYVVGSPICTDFGDLDQKRFLEIDVDNNGNWEVKSIPINHTKLVEINLDFVDEIKKPKIKLPDISNCGIKVKLRCRDDQIDSINVKKIQKDLEKNALFVRPIIPTIVKVQGKYKQIVKTGMTDKEIIDSWLSERYPGGYDRVKPLALEAIEES